MAQDLKKCVIQICDDSGNIRGTGFIIDANTAVTCAHVIEAAGAAPGDAVTVAFAQTGETRPAEILPDAWSPVEENDIAILRLQGELPAGVKPAILWSNEETANHSFQAFGYPEIGNFQGIWAEGKVLGSITDSQGTNMLQLRTQEIKAGMSGAPVLDTKIDRVVGMVTMTYNPDSTLKFRDTAFATPVEVIKEIWQSLELTPPAERQQPIFQRFAEAPGFIANHIRIREFQSLITEHTRNFVGREFIFKAINNLLDDPEFPSGYIVISGEPGIGKTALVGQLVKRSGYIHHFNIASQNIRSHRDFLSNICAQLIARYTLDYAMLPPEATQDSGFLSKLLAEVAAKEEDRPIVLLVDALDEVEDIGLASDANRLYLPRTLPEGVFFVVTSREEHDYRLLVDRREDIYLRDDDPHNLEDVSQYIRNFIQTYREEMEDRIKQWNVEEDEFVTVLTERSQGNFMYLVYVLRDIRAGRLTAANVDNIRKLPKSLRAYYQRHWRTMKAQDEQKFEQWYQPVVCILATVREPVSIEQLTEWTTLEPRAIVRVIHTWREFLNEDETEAGEPLYRIYHTSFQDFLREEVGLTRYHSIIAQTAWNKIEW